jgi:hypothetical protein
MSPERREQLREYQTQYNKAYWEKNREKLQADNRAWREMNYEQHIEYMTEYYKKNRDKFTDSQSKYRRENRGKVNSWVRMRNAQIKHRVFPEQKKAIAEFYDKCPKGYHVDHIVPINHPLVSGLHVLANLQYLTASENSSKRNRFVIE